MVCPSCNGRGCALCDSDLDSDAAIERLRELLAPAPARYDAEEILHTGGGSSFKVTDGDASLIFSTSDQPEAATVVTMRLPGALGGGRMKKNSETAWVCNDCIFLLANGEMPVEPTDREPLSRISADEGLTLGMMWDDHACGRPESGAEECNCEVRDFSTSTCEGCGDPLAGTRHATTLWWDERPQFEHDCDVCVFLGIFDGLDLYVHHDTWPTYIARRSSDGWDYKSGAVFVGLDVHLTEAHRLAEARGIALAEVGR